jgi:hypothetical protein
MNERQESQEVRGPNGRDQETTSDSLVEAMTAIERIGGRLSTGATGLGESAITSIGALLRRLIGLLGETARAGVDQSAEVAATIARRAHEGLSASLDRGAETAQQIVHVSQDTLERALDAAGSVAEDGVRLVERISVRTIDAASEIGGALLGRLPQTTSAARGSRPRSEPATPIVQAAS